MTARDTVTDPSDRDDELDSLLTAAIEGTLDAEDRAALEARLAADPAARAAYLEHIELHALLEWEHGRVGAPTPASGGGPLSSARGVRARRRTRRRRLVAAVAAIVTVVGVAGAILLRDPLAELSIRPGGSVAVAAPYYAKSRSSLEVVARLWTSPVEGAARRSVPIDASTVRLTPAAEEIRFHSGVRLRGEAAIGVVAERHAVLFDGALEVLETGGDRVGPFVLDTPAVRLIHRGAAFAVRIDAAGDVTARSVDGSITAYVRSRLPRRLWTFDEDSDDVRLGRGVTLVEGLVGAHAARFDDTPRAYVDVGEGESGGNIGRGGFATPTGVTVEALIVPEWSGRGASTGDDLDYDEIFRKEDGEYRILLSFQNDTWEYEVPDVERGPCLSFGLYLAGRGYSELDMPLDGRDGRPVLDDLRDGRAHHIVATYDAASGDKAIYIDGARRFHHGFPPGTLGVSGGPAVATIGNSGPGHDEPFRGVIDEVAVYGFALSAAEITAHHENIRRGLDYFGRDVGSRRIGRNAPDSLSTAAPVGENGERAGGAFGARTSWHEVAVIEPGRERRFDSKTGLPTGTPPEQPPTTDAADE